MLLTRRAAWILLAAAAWTLYIWGFRTWVIWGNDHSLAFKVVHTVLAAVSVGFGVYIGRLGYRAVRARRSSGARDPAAVGAVET